MVFDDDNDNDDSDMLVVGIGVVVSVVVIVSSVSVVTLEVFLVDEKKLVILLVVKLAFLEFLRPLPPFGGLLLIPAVLPS